MKKTYLFLVLLLIFSISISLYAQDSSKIIILSESVGPIVDLEEKIRYGILPNFNENFISAVYYLLPDSQFCYSVRLKYGDTFKDSMNVLGFNSVRNTAFRIQYIDKKRVGETDFNIDDTVLKFENNKYVANLDIEQKKLLDASVSHREHIQGHESSRVEKTPEIIFKKLPLEKKKIDFSEIIDNKLKFGVSFGLFFNSSNFSGLPERFNFFEKNIPEDGFVIPKSNLTFNASPIYKFSSDIIINNQWLVQLWYGFNVRSGNEYLSYKMASVSVGYLISIYKNTTLYVAGSYFGSEFNALKTYNIVVDSLGGELESISLTGNERGIKPSVGIKFKLTQLLSADIRGSYNFFPKISVNDHGDARLSKLPKVDVGGFELGISICFISN